MKRAELALTCLGLLAACFVWLQRPDGQWRYRLTISVDTPEGRHSGSSVIEVNVWRPLLRFRESGFPQKVIGEAVTVDLGDRGVFFGLLKSENDIENASQIVWKVFPWPGGPGGEATPPGLKYYNSLTGSARVPASVSPMLVRFRDLTAPETVERVHGSALGITFGDGVKLAAMVIEMVPTGVWPFNSLGLGAPQLLVGEPVTWGVEHRLPWLELFKNKQFDGDRVLRSDARNKLSNSLGTGSFIQGRW